MRLVYKLLSISSIALLILMPITLLSGLAMVKQFAIPWFNNDLAIYLHTNIAVLIVILVVYVHSLSGILVVFQRHPKWNKKLYKIPVCIFWTLLFAVMAVLFLIQPPAKP